VRAHLRQCRRAAAAARAVPARRRAAHAPAAAAVAARRAARALAGALLRRAGARQAAGAAGAAGTTAAAAGKQQPAHGAIVRARQHRHRRRAPGPRGAGAVAVPAPLSAGGAAGSSRSKRAVRAVPARLRPQRQSQRAGDVQAMVRAAQAAGPAAAVSAGAGRAARRPSRMCCGRLRSRGARPAAVGAASLAGLAAACLAGSTGGARQAAAAAAGTAVTCPAVLRGPYCACPAGPAGLRAAIIAMTFPAAARGLCSVIRQPRGAAAPAALVAARGAAARARAAPADLQRAALNERERERGRRGRRRLRERERAAPAAARHARQLAATRRARQHELGALARCGPAPGLAAILVVALCLHHGMATRQLYFTMSLPLINCLVTCAAAPRVASAHGQPGVRTLKPQTRRSPPASESAGAAASAAATATPRMRCTLSSCGGAERTRRRVQCAAIIQARAQEDGAAQQMAEYLAERRKTGKACTAGTGFCSSTPLPGMHIRCASLATLSVVGQPPARGSAAELEQVRMPAGLARRAGRPAPQPAPLAPHRAAAQASGHRRGAA